MKKCNLKTNLAISKVIENGIKSTDLKPVCVRTLTTLFNMDYPSASQAVSRMKNENVSLKDAIILSLLDENDLKIREELSNLSNS